MSTPAFETPTVRRHIQEVAYGRLKRDRSYASVFHDVACSFADGVLTLEGRVPSFYLKQILQTRLLGIEGVEQLDNRVHVQGSSGS